MTPSDVLIVADAFARVIRDQGYACYACAIMPDHINLVIGKHKHLAEEMIEHFQQVSKEALIEAGARTNGHPVWGGPGWKIFLDTPEDICRTIRYVDDNPIKMRLPRQTWTFVTRYDDWPHHKRRGGTKRA